MSDTWVRPTETERSRVLFTIVATHKQGPMSIEITRPFTAGEVDDILSTAFEGGINYWCDRVTRPKHSSTRTYCCEALAYDGVVLTLYDNEDGNGAGAEHHTRRTLSVAGVERGLQLYMENRGAWPGDGEWDAGDADRVVQWGLFGGLVYG